MGKVSVKLREELSVRPPPGVDRLVRIPHNEQVLMVPAETFHEIILQLIDVLKLVDHDIFQPFLPLQFHFLRPGEDEQRELDQIVIIQTEAFLLLVEVAIKNDVRNRPALVVLLFQRCQGHGDQIVIVQRFPEGLPDLDHVPGTAEGHVPQRESALFVNHLQHLIDILIVQHQETLRVAAHMTVLLENRYTEPVEGADVTSVVVSGQNVNPLPHFVGGLVREGNAQNMPGQNAQFIHQISETVGKGPGLSRPRTGDDPHVPFR